MNKKWIRVVGVALSMALMLSSVATAAPAGFAAELPALHIAEMEVNSLTAPMGIDQNPTFSWGLDTSENGRSQSAYRLVVSSTPEQAANGEGDIWDTGKTAWENNFDIPYAGPALQSKTPYYWSVQVWDDQDRKSGWSEVSSFETGMLSQSDWVGEWIGDSLASDTVGMKVDGCNWIWSRYGAPLDQTPEGHQYFRKTFSIDPARTVSKVVFGYTVDDKGKFYLNGELVGESETWQSGAAFDITDRVVAGENTIALDGHNTSLGYGGLIGRLRIEYADGESAEIITDGSWKLTSAPGNGWEQPGFDDSSWETPDQILPYGSAPWGTQVNISTTVTEVTSAPLLRKEFEVKGEVASARAYVCGLGLFDLKINGENPDDTVLNPAHTQYNKSVFYRVFDVAPLLKAGDNAIGVELGKSFYNETVSTWNWQNAAWRDNPKLLMQLEIRYADGTTETVATGTDWKVASDGPTVFDSIYYGETYDARQEKMGFDQPGYSEDESWHDAVVVSAPTGKLKFQQMEPMRQIQAFNPEVTKLANGSYIITNPEMTTGWMKLTLDAPAGTEVTITYGERLHADGTLQKQGNDSWFYRTIQQDKYICKGEPGESFEPRFSYKGYKYIQIDGYPGELTADQVVCYAIHNEVGKGGSFSSSNEQINALHEIMARTILNNFQGKPTDTPVWEKNGWTGDANVSTETMAYNFDIRSFLAKFLEDLEDCQTDSGIIPNIAPTADWGVENTPVWNTIYILATQQLVNQYGMETFSASQYDSMRKLMTLTISEIQRNGWVWGDGQLADWVAPSGGTDPNVGGNATASEGSGICGTGYVYEALKAMADIADRLGKADDAAQYRAAMEQIYTAFNAKFYKPEEQIYQTTHWANPGERTRFRQTSQLVPLAFGLVPEEYKQGVLDNLVKDIEQKGYHLDTGMVGTKLLLPVLSDNGYADVAYRVLTQTTYPSWGYWLEQGATSTWEGYENTARSENHYFLGTYDEWLFKGLAGIRDFEDGAKAFVIHPQLTGGLEWVSAKTMTARGEVSSSWKLQDNGTALFEVTVPVGATAQLILPTSRPDQIFTSDGVAVSTALPGVTAVEAVGESTSVTIGSGRYSFVSATDGVERYTAELQSAVDYAGTLAQEDYESQAWDLFAAALSSAKETLVNGSQIEINRAVADLEAAVEQLKQYPNQARIDLKALLEEYSTLQREDYFGDYWDTFAYYYNEAQSQVKDLSISEDMLRQSYDLLEMAAGALAYYRSGNIALGGKVSASSTVNASNGWHIDYLTDGDRINLSSAGEYCGWTSNNDINQNHQEWVSVDLGIRSRFDTLTVYPSVYREDSPGYGMPVDFDIQVSNDGVNWQTVHSERDYPLPDYGPQTFTFESCYAQYVRLYAYSLRPKVTDNNLYRMQLTELELYTTPVEQATLGSLTLSAGELNPAFDPAVRSYSVTVPNEVYELKVEGTVNGDGTFMITCDPSIDYNPDNSTVILKEGETRLRIDVMTDGSRQMQYTDLVIIREPGETPDAADKSILRRVIEYARGVLGTVEFDQAISSVQQNFHRALGNAVSADEDSNATQDKVDAAWIRLMNAIHQLGFKRGDTAQLSFLIEQAQALDLGNYVAAGQEEFTGALTAAREMLTNEDAMQQDVDEAVSRLLDAMLALRYKADKSLLFSALSRAALVDTAAYTPESVEAFHSAFADARTAAKDEALSVDDQAAVDYAAAALGEAIDALVPIAGEQQAAASTGAPKTGDTAAIPAVFLALVLAGFALGKKKK